MIAHRTHCILAAGKQSTITLPHWHNDFAAISDFFTLIPVVSSHFGLFEANVLKGVVHAKKTCDVLSDTEKSPLPPIKLKTDS
jgi:hypothetical protein